MKALHSQNSCIRARATACPSRGSLVVCHPYHDDDDHILPLFKLPPRKGEAPTNLPKPRLLGGKTIGDELSLIQKSHARAERKANRGVEGLNSDNWQGDEYVGSRWNILSLMMGLMIAIPVAGLLFAWATYGTLWGLVEFGGAKMVQL